jgi:hypothetical protein
MKHRSILLLALATLFLTACATAPAPRSPTVVDQDYVGAVNAKARFAGVDVVWVNPPRQDRETEETP